jgi:hypothetical protein
VVNDLQLVIAASALDEATVPSMGADEDVEIVVRQEVLYGQSLEISQ